MNTWLYIDRYRYKYVQKQLLLAFTEMQIKMPVKYHYNSTNMAKI